MSHKAVNSPHLQKEIALLRQGYRFIAGLDEAGRGAWAGPVVAATVILPANSLELTNSLELAYSPDLPTKLFGLRDSKKLTPAKRERLFSLIQETAVAVAVGYAPAAQVDKLNVIGATRHAMQQALAELQIAPDYLLIDHLKLPAITIPQDAFPKADDISLSVAAASVVAKVTRDRLMVEFSQTYPLYAFDRHKGYGTKVHRAALRQHGPCPIHRMSFRPLQSLLIDSAEV